MRRFVLVLLLAGCSKAPQSDLQYIGQARSAAAEWALINAEAARGKLTHSYVESMRTSVAKQIETAHSALSVPDSDYGREMAALLAAPPDSPPAEIRSHSDRLEQIEKSLESA